MTLEMMRRDGNVDRRAQKRVLIVEDNDLNMKLFNDLLEAHGYFTLQTKDGVEALRMARQHRPDLILMDIQLPEVSGLEVTKWLKEDDDLRTIPVIAVTARVLVVDDVELNVRLLTAKLTSEYFEVLSADNGPAALAMTEADLPDI